MPTKTSSLAELPPRPVRSDKLELPASSIQRALPGSSAIVPGRLRSAAWSVLALAVFSVVARLGLHWGLPFPQCWLRKLTGVPCPSCGCTRSLAAWTDLNLEQAFRFNPLFFCLCVALILWLGVSAVERFTGRVLLSNARNGLRRWPVWKIGLALVALNWLYLCLRLPK